MARDGHGVVILEEARQSVAQSVAQGDCHSIREHFLQLESPNMITVNTVNKEEPTRTHNRALHQLKLMPTHLGIVDYVALATLSRALLVDLI